MYEFNSSVRLIWTPDFKLYDYGCIYCVSKFDIMFSITIVIYNLQETNNPSIYK
jgi:hypothetical protein